MERPNNTHVARERAHEVDSWLSKSQRYTFEPGGCRVVAGEELHAGDVAWLDFYTGNVTKLSPIEMATLHG